MNRAEYIIASIERANKRDAISQRESVRVLTEVASLLNSGMSAAEIDNAPGMKRLWKEVGRKWGKP
jgi:hypothetical protein